MAAVEAGDQRFTAAAKLMAETDPAARVTMSRVQAVSLATAVQKAGASPEFDDAVLAHWVASAVVVGLEESDLQSVMDGIMACCKVTPKRKARQAYQNYSQVIGYFDENEWALMSNCKEKNPGLVYVFFSTRLNQLGYISGSEWSNKFISSSMQLILHGNDDAWMLPPHHLVAECQKFKESYKKLVRPQKKKEPSMRWDVLPATPGIAKAEFPVAWAATFGDVAFVPSKVCAAAVAKLDGSTTCRGSGVLHQPVAASPAINATGLPMHGLQMLISAQDKQFQQQMEFVKSYATGALMDRPNTSESGSLPSTPRSKLGAPRLALGDRSVSRDAADEKFDGAVAAMEERHNRMAARRILDKSVDVESEGELSASQPAKPIRKRPAAAKPTGPPRKVAKKPAAASTSVIRLEMSRSQFVAWTGIKGAGQYKAFKFTSTASKAAAKKAAQKWLAAQ